MTDGRELRRRADVHAQHHARLLGGPHERIPVATKIVDGGQPERLGVLGERDRGDTFGGAAFYLARNRGRVPQRHDDERDEAAGRGGAPLVDHPVVVGLHAEERELLVLGLVEDLPAEARERREAQRREDVAGVHVLDAGLDVVAPGQHVGIGDRVRGKKRFAGLAGAGGQTTRRHEPILVRPELTVIEGDQTRSDVAVASGHAVLPHGGRLEHVIIDRDHPIKRPFTSEHRVPLRLAPTRHGARWKNRSCRSELSSVKSQVRSDT
ncbi:unannotated protein [freshwater metagenome]|uniref:Unannotated protein n=1 Tax=freshwater metagenome TaxID=449393 RepID=A0A6J7AUL0_9ZZZZ